MLKGFLKLLKREESKTNQCMKTYLNFDLQPSIFEIDGEKFLGDYIGKFSYGHKYKIVERFIVLEETAKVIRSATPQEVSLLENKRFKRVC